VEAEMANAKADYSKVAAPRIVDAPDQRWNMFPYLMVVMVTLTLVALFHVWSRFRVYELTQQITDARHAQEVALQEQKRLKVEKEMLKNPARIDTIAKTELGMVLPSDQQVIAVK